MEKIIENRKSFIINFFYFAIFIGLYYFVVKYAFGYILPFVVAATLAVFLHLLIMANIEDKKYRGYDVKRGECIIGRKSLAEDLNMSEQNVRTAINHLLLTNEITIKTTTSYIA